MENISTKISLKKNSLNIIIIIFKIVAGVISGSLSILVETLHSTINLSKLAPYFSHLILKDQSKKDFNFKLIKLTNVLSIIEATFILITSFVFIYLSISKVFILELGMQNLFTAFIIILSTAFINLRQSRQLLEKANKEKSLKLEVEAMQIEANFYITLGVGFGVFLVWTSGFIFIDSIIAIIVSIFIIRKVLIKIRSAYKPIANSSLSREEINEIKAVFSKDGYSIRKLHTRKSGNANFAEVYLELPIDLKLEEVHQICNELEAKVKLKISNIQLTIHVENENMN